MKGSIPRRLITFWGALALGTLIISACNTSDPPVTPGSGPSFVSQNCTGVFGNNTMGAYSAGPGYIFYNPFVAGSNATLVSLSVYSASSTPVTYETGVYSNSSTLPYTLLGETGPVTINGPATMWNTAPLAHNISLSNGVTYWLALEYNSSSFRYGSASVAYADQTAGAFGSLPSPASATLESDYFLSIYGTTCP